MGEIIKPAAILLAICVVVSGALALTSYITRDSIKERALEEAKNARLEVLPGADEFEEVGELEKLNQAISSGSTITGVYRVKKAGSALGYVFSLTAKGYGGDMAITVGIDMDGKITGVKIGDHKETPGLGSRAADKEFLSRLSGFAPQKSLTVVKGGSSSPEEIDAISGATVTSRAVVGAVQAAVDAFGQLKN